MAEGAASVPIDRRPYGGLGMTHERMAKFIADGIREDIGIKGLAARTLRDAGFPKATREKVQVLRDYVKKNVGYGNDPPLTEYIQKAHITLCTGDLCVPMEDCDGHVVALLTLLGSVGIDVNILALDYGPGIQPHVLGMFRDDGGDWLEVDSTTDRPIGHVSSAAKKTRIDPFDPKFQPAGEAKTGTFVGAGRPWDDAPMLTGYAQAVLGAGAAPPKYVKGGAVNAGVFTLSPGRKVRYTTVATGGDLSGIYAGQTIPTVQARFDVGHPGEYSITSVQQSPSQLVIEADYCGTKPVTATSPSVVSFGGVTISTTMEDIGAASSCGGAVTVHSVVTPTTPSIPPPGREAVDLLNVLTQRGCVSASFPECVAFQKAYNMWVSQLQAARLPGPSYQLATDGEYGPCTQEALASVLANQGTSVPAPCFPGRCVNGRYVAPLQSKMGYGAAIFGDLVGAGAPLKWGGGAGGNGVGGVHNVGINLFQMAPGRRIRVLVSAPSGQELPIEYQQDTEATLQASLAAAGISATVIAGSVVHPNTSAERFEVDYTGPTKSVANPTVDPNTGISTRYTDVGASPWSYGKKVAVFGGGALAVAAVAGGIYWATR